MNHNPTTLCYLVLISFGIFFIPNTSLAQDYQINFLGIPCVSVVMDQPEQGKLNFRTRTIGIIDQAWPVDNQYFTTFDLADFGIRAYNKKIKQGKFEQKLTLEYDSDSHEVVYNAETRIERQPDTQTIFTILARITQESAEQLDTRWFELEHEGSLYKARLLWADSVSLKINNSTYKCDHYRLDIVPTTGTSENILQRTDYFSEYIMHPTAVRQLWVTRDDDQKIVKASVKLHGFTLEARLKNE